MRSAAPLSPMGVATAMKITSPCSIPRRLSVVKSMQPILPVPVDQLGQAGLIDRDLSGEKPVYLGLVDIDADDVVAAVRQAGARDEADVAGSDYRYLQD